MPSSSSPGSVRTFVRPAPLLARCRCPWVGWVQVITAALMILGPLPSGASWSDSDSNGYYDTWIDPYTSAATTLSDMNNQNWDADNDGASNDEEALEQSDPYSYDSDYDGLNDGDELHLVKPSLGVSLTNWDSDGDYISDYDEWYTYSGYPSSGVTYPWGQLPNFPGASYSDYDGDGQKNPVDPYPTDPANGGPSPYTDTDMDGIMDAYDPFPNDSSNYSSNNGITWYSDVLGDADGDGTINYQDFTPYPPPPPPQDDDGDGIGNDSDPFPSDSSNYSSYNGIAWYNYVLGDTDGDGVPNWQDSSPAGVSIDGDGDGFFDSSDPFPSDASNYSSINGINWYGDVSGDADGDGIANWCDLNPYYAPDDDNDGIGNHADPYPSDPNNSSIINGWTWYGQVLGDADQDGIVNWQDPVPFPDTDGDGIYDNLDPFPADPLNYSAVNATAWQGNVLGDADSDTFLNYLDPFPEDDDNFSTANNTFWSGSIFGDLDGDGLLNWQDPWPYHHIAADVDGDGLTAHLEAEYGTSDTNVDSDADGLTDYEEKMIYNTNPADAYSRSMALGRGRAYTDYYFVDLSDSDSDGIPNRVEELFGLNPYDAADAAGDLDANGITNFVQYQYGMSLYAELASYDNDQDGMSDVVEDHFQLNKTWFGDAMEDADGDGVLNFEEIKLVLSPKSPDSRGLGAGGLSPGRDMEVLLEAALYPEGGAPTVDENSNGIADWMETALVGDSPRFVRVASGDLDGDGIPDFWEHEHGPWKYPSLGLYVRQADGSGDPDGDGLTNLNEYLSWTHPFVADSDGNGVMDADEDRDSDGLNNGQEVVLGTNISNGDSDHDGYSDADEHDGGTDPTNASSHASNENVRIPFQVVYTGWKGGEVAATPPGFGGEEEPPPSGSTYKGWKQKYKYVLEDLSEPPDGVLDGPPEEQPDGTAVEVDLSNQDAAAWVAANNEPTPPYYYISYHLDIAYDAEGQFLSATRSKLRYASDSADPVVDSQETLNQQQAEEELQHPTPSKYELGDSEWTRAWAEEISGSGGTPRGSGPEEFIPAQYTYTRPLDFFAGPRWVNDEASQTITSESDLSSNIPALNAADLVFATSRLTRGGGILAVANGWFDEFTTEYETEGGGTATFTGANGKYMHGHARISWDPEWPVSISQEEKEVWMGQYFVTMIERNDPAEDPEDELRVISIRPLRDVINQQIAIDPGNPREYEGTTRTREMWITRIELDPNEEIIVPADIAEAPITAMVQLPDPFDEAELKWKIEEGSGALSEQDVTTENRVAETILMTNHEVGSTYRVSVEVQALIQKNDDDTETRHTVEFKAPIAQTPPTIVGPGAASNIVVESQGGTGAGGLPADGKSEVTVKATFTDAHGNPLAEGSRIFWHLQGSGKIVEADEETKKEGGNSVARAVVRAGDIPGLVQKLVIETDLCRKEALIRNDPLTFTLEASDPQWSGEVGASTATVAVHATVDAADGTAINWATSRGGFVSAQTTVMGGQAQATLQIGTSQAGSGLAVVTASVARSLAKDSVLLNGGAAGFDEPVVAAQNIQGNAPSQANLHIHAPQWAGRMVHIVPQEIRAWTDDAPTGKELLFSSGTASLDVELDQDGRASVAVLAPETLNASGMAPVIIHVLTTGNAVDLSAPPARADVLVLGADDTGAGGPLAAIAGLVETMKPSNGGVSVEEKAELERAYTEAFQAAQGNGFVSGLLKIFPLEGGGDLPNQAAHGRWRLKLAAFLDAQTAAIKDAAEKASNVHISDSDGGQIVINSGGQMQVLDNGNGLLMEGDFAAEVMRAIRETYGNAGWVDKLDKTLTFAQALLQLHSQGQAQYNAYVESHDSYSMMGVGKYLVERLGTAFIGLADFTGLKERFTANGTARLLKSLDKFMQTAQENPSIFAGLVLSDLADNLLKPKLNAWAVSENTETARIIVAQAGFVFEFVNSAGMMAAMAGEASPASEKAILKHLLAHYTGVILSAAMGSAQARRELGEMCPFYSWYLLGEDVKSRWDGGDYFGAGRAGFITLLNVVGDITFIIPVVKGAAVVVEHGTSLGTKLIQKLRRGQAFERLSGGPPKWAEIRRLVQSGAAEASDRTMRYLEKLRMVNQHIEIEDWLGIDSELRTLKEMQAVQQVEFMIVRKGTTHYFVRGDAGGVNPPSWAHELVAHSHPGTNIFAVIPSPTDMRTLKGRVQRGTHPPGNPHYIVTQDGIAVEFVSDAKRGMRVKRVWRVGQ